MKSKKNKKKGKHVSPSAEPALSTNAVPLDKDLTEHGTEDVPLSSVVEQNLTEFIDSCDRLDTVPTVRFRGVCNRTVYWRLEASIECELCLKPKLLIRNIYCYSAKLNI